MEDLGMCRKCDQIRSAYESVKSGTLSEGSFIFVVGLIVDPHEISEEGMAWANREIEKRGAAMK